MRTLEENNDIAPTHIAESALEAQQKTINRLREAVQRPSLLLANLHAQRDDVRRSLIISYVGN